MLLNSYIFILVFLPITLLGYFGLNKLSSKYGSAISKGFLLLSSLVFYGYFNYRYLYIIIGSILVNYIICSFLIKKKDHKLRKLVFVSALIINIGALLYFKYFNFFVSNINSLFGTDFVLLKIMLPLGISFFTFSQIAYVIDAYALKSPLYNFWDYALYVSFFSKVTAGPIALHYDIIPQFNDSKTFIFNNENFAKGLCLFSIGLAKKVLLADKFGLIADYGFSSIGEMGSLNAFLVMLAYTFQIYFDFSGYSDMAIGSAYMFNIKMPVNFNSPYKALSVIDFWKRWHITLTKFFTQYLYIPLGGSRKGNLRTYLNIMIVFTISGLWHGANWTFIVWGLFHGIGQVINRLFNMKKTESKIKNFFLWLLCFIFINFTWIIFRADSLRDSLLFFKDLFSFKLTAINDSVINAFQFIEFKYILDRVPFIGDFIFHNLYIIGFVLGFVISVLIKNAFEENNPWTKLNKVTLWFLALLMVWGILSLSNISSFVYWKF